MSTITKDHGRPRRSAARSSGIAALVSDGVRSFTSLGFDGWMAIVTLVISAVALVELMTALRIDGVNAGEIWFVFYIVTCIRLFQAMGAGWPFWMLKRHTVLCCFLAFALLSTAWSEHPDVSLNRSISLVGTTLIGVYVGQLLSQRALMAAWIWGMTVLLVVSLTLYVYAPDLVVLEVEDWAGRFQGFASNKNHAGKFLALGTILLAAATSRAMIDRVVGICLTTMFAAAALLADSTTSLLSLIAGVGAIAGILMAKRIGLSVTAVIVLMGIGTLVLAAVGIVYVEVLTTWLGKKPTLSGRTLLWTAIIDTMARHPFIGYGYFAIWGRPETNAFLNSFTPDDFRWSGVVHAHNGFFQVATDLGIPVALLSLAYVAFTLILAVRSFYRDDTAFSVFAVGFVCSFIVMNIGEPYLLRSRAGMWIVFVAVTVALVRQSRSRRTSNDEAPEPTNGSVDTIPTATQLRQRLRAALPVPAGGIAGGASMTRELLKDALTQRHGDPSSRSSELRRRFRGMLTPRGNRTMPHPRPLRPELRGALQQRHDDWRGERWSSWSGIRPYLRKALLRRDDGDGKESSDDDASSSSR